MNPDMEKIQLQKILNEYKKKKRTVYVFCFFLYHNKCTNLASYIMFEEFRIPTQILDTSNLQGFMMTTEMSTHACTYNIFKHVNLNLSM